MPHTSAEVAANVSGAAPPAEPHAAASPESLLLQHTDVLAAILSHAAPDTSARVSLRTVCKQLHAIIDSPGVIMLPHLKLALPPDSAAYPLRLSSHQIAWLRSVACLTVALPPEPGCSSGEATAQELARAVSWLVEICSQLTRLELEGERRLPAGLLDMAPAAGSLVRVRLSSPAGWGCPHGPLSPLTALTSLASLSLELHGQSSSQLTVLSTLQALTHVAVLGAKQPPRQRPWKFDPVDLAGLPALRSVALSWLHLRGGAMGGTSTEAAGKSNANGGWRHVVLRNFTGDVVGARVVCPDATQCLVLQKAAEIPADARISNNLRALAVHLSHPADFELLGQLGGLRLLYALNLTNPDPAEGPHPLLAYLRHATALQHLYVNVGVRFRPRHEPDASMTDVLSALPTRLRTLCLLCLLSSSHFTERQKTTAARVLAMRHFFAPCSARLWPTAEGIRDLLPKRLADVTGVVVHFHMSQLPALQRLELVAPDITLAFPPETDQGLQLLATRAAEQQLRHAFMLAGHIDMGACLQALHQASGAVLSQLVLLSCVPPDDHWRRGRRLLDATLPLLAGFSGLRDLQLGFFKTPEAVIGAMRGAGDLCPALRHLVLRLHSSVEPAGPAWARVDEAHAGLAAQRPELAVGIYGHEDDASAVWPPDPTRPGMRRPWDTCCCALHPEVLEDDD